MVREIDIEGSLIAGWDGRQQDTIEQASSSTVAPDPAMTGLGGLMFAVTAGSGDSGSSALSRTDVARLPNLPLNVDPGVLQIGEGRVEPGIQPSGLRQHAVILRDAVGAFGWAVQRPSERHV
jgi:hypothetical protein